MRLTCPQCESALDLPDAGVGQNVFCYKCGAKIEVTTEMLSASSAVEEADALSALANATEIDEAISDAPAPAAAPPPQAAAPQASQSSTTLDGQSVSAAQIRAAANAARIAAGMAPLPDLPAPAAAPAPAAPQQTMDGQTVSAEQIRAAANAARVAAGLPPLPPVAPQAPAPQAASPEDDGADRGGFDPLSSGFDRNRSASAAKLKLEDPNMVIDEVIPKPKEERKRMIPPDQLEPGMCPQCGGRNMVGGGTACMDCDYSVKVMPKGISLSFADEAMALVQVVTSSLIGRIVLGTLGLAAITTVIVFAVEGSGLLDSDEGPQTATPQVITWNEAAPPKPATVDKNDPTPHLVELKEMKAAEAAASKQGELSLLANWGRLRKWDDESKPRLIAALNSDDEVVGLAGVEAMKLIGPDCVETLTPMLTVGNPRVLRRASEVLATFGSRSRSAMEPLIKACRLLTDDSVTVLTRTERYEALRAVARAMEAIDPEMVDTADWVSMVDEKDGDVTAVVTRVLLARNEKRPVEGTVLLQRALLELIGSEQLGGDAVRGVEARHTAAKLLVAVVRDSPGQTIRELTRMLTSVEHVQAGDAVGTALIGYGERAIRPVLAVKVEALMRAAGVEPASPLFDDSALGNDAELQIGGKAWEVDPGDVVARTDTIFQQIGADGIGELLKVIDSPADDATRTTAVETLAPLAPGHHGQIVPVLAKVLRDPVVAVRCREIILGLPPIGPAAVPDLLGEEYLKTGSKEDAEKRDVLMTYIEGLGEAGLPLIEKLLANPEPSVQRATVAILGRLKRSEAVMDVAINALGCSDLAAQRKAVTIVVIYGQAAVPRLKTLAGESNPNANEREGASQALKLLGAG